MGDGTSVRGKTALVTGASTGIGRAIARKLAADGADVGLIARSEGKLRTVAEAIESEYGVTALALPADVSDHEQAEGAVERATAEFGALDVVINNAGVGQVRDIEDLSVEEFRTMNGVNIDGVFYVTRASLPHLRDSAGNLIFVGSTAGRYLEPEHPAYAATKWWLRGFAHNLAGSVGEDDIAVTTVNPTAVRTEFGSEFREPNREAFEEGSVLEPEDVAEAVAFAAAQTPPKTVHELDLTRRNEFSGVDRF